MYVVTGASGNSGHVVAETLLARGHKVRAIGRSAERLQLLARLGAEPFVCDLTDRSALAKAFAGAQGVYAMIPPDVTAHDYRAFQDRVTDALAAAITESRVKHVVALSSFGADKAEKTGPVVGLHHLENKLNQIPGLHVLHLRAGYFMENTLAQIGIIKAIGVTAGPLRGELELPLIATRDIGTAAAERLLKFDFTGSQSRELLGQRDISMAEAAGIIGRAIGRPHLSYTRLPNAAVRAALLQMGISANVADLILEMAEALNAGHMAALEKRSVENTTPTSYETFVKSEFAPQFLGKPATA
jgi:uncharacterized protein YbjT (DUF2867 family)